MKTILLAGFALSCLAGSAAAADMPVKALPPPPVAPFDWNGFYLGAYWGVAISQNNARSDLHDGSVDINAVGFTGGLQGGANWQFVPNWLIGVEADIGALGTDRHFSDYGDPINNLGFKTRWYGTARGRLGYVTGPSVLYATGGAAFVDARESFGGEIGPFVGPTTHSNTRTGWTAGGGIETKLSRNWSAKVEYLYIDIGHDSFVANVGGVPETATFNNTFHVFKSGLNYRFGGPDEGFPFFNPVLLAPAFYWAGFYVGANVGVGISATHVGLNDNVNFTSRGGADVNGTGVTGGILAGYNWSVGGPWVVGIESDSNYLGIDRSYPEWFELGRFPRVEANWYGTVRGRVGWTTGPALLYVTGGVAFAHVTNSLASTATGVTATSTGTRTGWVVGGGIETPVVGNWLARLEYLYMDVGPVDINNTSISGGIAHFDNRFQVVRAGFAYRFGGYAAPVVVSASY